MDQAEEALEKLNRVFEEKIVAVEDGNCSLDDCSKSKIKIEIFEQWKNSLIKYTKKCVETIANSTRVLEKSISDSSDDASKVSRYKSNSTQVYRQFSEQIPSLKQIINEMGTRSQQALIELEHIVRLCEKQLHHNKSLTQENVMLKSELETVRSKTSYYNDLVDKILSNMKAESIDLKRFFTEYEKRIQNIEHRSSQNSDEMRRRLKSLEIELASKNQQIDELQHNLQQFGKPVALPTLMSSNVTSSASSIAPKTISVSEGENNIYVMQDSYEINLTDLEAYDDKKIQTLEDGSRTMAKLLKEKQHMLREQKSVIQQLRQQLKQSKVNCATIDRLQDKLNQIQVENTNLFEECQKLRSMNEDSEKLRDKMTKISNEKKHHEEALARTLSAQEEQIQKLIEDRQRLAQTNYDLFNSISICYKELGNCVAKTVK